MTDIPARLNATLEGRYRIEREIGEGGMATVYLAEDLKHGRKVALKVLKPELAAMVGAERFLAEIRTTANLQHPHILGLHDSGEADGLLFYVMPYVAGESLRDRLNRERQLPVDEAVQIATSVAEALDYAHRQGVVHRDIKPANILLQEGKPVVSDFGIALAVQAGGRGRLTETGLSLGTPHYMSPEQATGDEQVGAATDVYALACVLYEMLVGEPPYTGSSPQSILGKILQAEPVSAAASRRSVPAHVDAAIRRALEKVPADRFVTGRDFVAALGDPGFRHGAAAGAAAGSGPAPGRWLVAALVVLTLAASSLAVWSLTTGPTPQGPIRFTEPPPPGGRFITAPVISPDGRTLAMHVEEENGETRIWVRPLEAEAARPLEGTEGVMGFAWSPSSTELVYGVGAEVRRVTLDGAGNRLVAVMPVVGVVWTPEDDLIVLPVEGGVVRIPAGGGTARNLTEGMQFRSLDLVEGGRHLLLTQFGGETGIHALDLDTGEDRMLVPGVQSDVRHLPPDLFLYAQGPLVVAQRFDPGTMDLVGDPMPVARDVGSYTTSGSGGLSLLAGGRGGYRIVWFDREGRILGEAAPEGRYTEVYLSPDGSRMMFTRGDPATGRADLWIAPVDGDAPPSRFTTDPDQDHLASFSPDGAAVAWEAHSEGELVIVRKPVDGRSQPERIGRWGRAGGVSDWSPDERHLLYHSTDGDGSVNLWMVPLAADEEPFPLVESPFDHGTGQFSPDGRWLAYTSDETGQSEVYLQRLEGTRLAGAPVRVSDGGGREPLWRQDGGELFFLSGDGVMSVDTRLGQDSPAGTPRALFDLRARHQLNNYAVTPDGERILAIIPVEDGQQESATVVLDWVVGVGSGG
jgi:serine/threonine-protein kinase